MCRRTARRRPPVRCRDQQRRRDGFETQFGTNHLGHFLLVNRIAPIIATGGRVVSLASAGHRFADVDLEDPNFEHTPYAPFVAYGRSKTANVLFAVGFDRRFKSRGIRAAAVHPGGIRTELGRHTDQAAEEEMIRGINERNAAAGLPLFRYKTVPQGAATSVWAAVVAAGDDVGGRYCEDCHVARVVDDPDVRGGVQPYALDPDRADALWQMSEKMVGEEFDVADRK
jgi:NAD(P)-dependent dehydrogenase (short-subunit alcohol dehydrogenase family)